MSIVQFEGTLANDCSGEHNQTGQIFILHIFVSLYIPYRITKVTPLVFRVHRATVNRKQSKESEWIMEFPLIFYCLT